MKRYTSPKQSILACVASMEETKWQNIPEHIVVRILSYLKLSDRRNVALTCKRWWECFDSPVLWQTLKFEFLDSEEFKYTECLENHGEYLRNVYVHCSQADKTNRENACALIRKISNLKVRRLERITVKFTGENPLFYAGHEFIACLRELFEKPKDNCEVLFKLKSVDLSKLPVAYGDDLINCLVENNPALDDLNIQNASLVCNVTSACIQNVLRHCRQLRSLALHYTSVTEEILLSLTEEDRVHIEHLSIDCRREEKYVKDISSETWQEIRRKIPELRVTLAFDCSCPMFKVNEILKPEVPVKVLKLELMSRVVYQVYFAAENYYETLEMLSISTTSSRELEQALIHLATRCEALRELCVFQCSISQETADKLLRLRPGIKRLLVKTR